MLFLLSKWLPGFYPVLALITCNLVTSMPAPSKRSPLDASEARNGFSSVSKILEIQLPLKIASKDDLVAWAKYVMGLMASKINITLTTVKESPAKNPGGVRAPELVRPFDGSRQSQSNRNLAFKGFEVAKPRQTSDARQFEGNARYAENVRNLGHAMNFDRAKVPAAVRILENARHLEGSKGPSRSGNVQFQGQAKDGQFSTARVPAIAISGVTAKTLFNNRPLQPFGSLAVTDATLPNPLEITASINVPRSRNREPGFKGNFDANSGLKVGQQQFFVPQFPDFGPVIDVKANDVFKGTNTASTPARAYLPVTATTDNIRFPSDPFVTRYFFDGVERNETNDFGSIATDVAFTTSRPLILADEIPLPVRSLDLVSQQRNASSLKPLFNVPFEALITFTREGPSDATTALRNDAERYFTVSTREPFEQFPPYFDSNYTQTNESGQINVVFDDEVVGDAKNSTKPEERRKQEKKKESSKKQKSKKQKTATRLESPIGQFLKNLAALRRNSTPSVDLTPPPLKQEFTTQKIPTRQRLPPRQNAPPDQRPQQYYPPRKPPPALRQGRRNQTSLAQELEDDDDSGSREDNGSTENSASDENDEKGDVESDEGGSNESSSSQSDEDDSSEEEGGFINAVIELLQFAAPLLDDLSDPESDTTLGDVIEAGIPLFEELSENNDIPGILGPILLEVSGGANGAADSAAVFRPLIQLIAPLSGPLSGPLLIPLSRQSSQPPGQGGSSIGDLLKTSLEPLLQPVGPGKMTMLSNLLAGVISSLSKNSSGGGKSDIASLVKAIVTGSVAGTSAGSSGGKGDSYGAPTGYETNYAYGPPSSPPYAQPNRPSQHPNPLLLLGSSIKDILNAITKVVTSLVNAVTGVLGASSNSSNEPRPKYGPPRPAYGPPRPTYGPTRQPYRAPPSDTISITTSQPERFSRF